MPVGVSFHSFLSISLSLTLVMDIVDQSGRRCFFFAALWIVIQFVCDKNKLLERKERIFGTTLFLSTFILPPRVTGFFFSLVFLRFLNLYFCIFFSAVDGCMASSLARTATYRLKHNKLKRHQKDHCSSNNQQMLQQQRQQQHRKS